MTKFLAMSVSAFLIIQCLFLLRVPPTYTDCLFEPASDEELQEELVRLIKEEFDLFFGDPPDAVKIVFGFRVDTMGVVHSVHMYRMSVIGDGGTEFDYFKLARLCTRMEECFNLIYLRDWYTDYDDWSYNFYWNRAYKVLLVNIPITVRYD